MQAVTVGIETGYQNPSIPIVMLTGNFQQPEGDLGAVMPVATAFFTPVPLYFWYLYIEIRKKCCKKGEVDAKEGEEIEEREKSGGERVEAGEEEGKIGDEGSDKVIAKEGKENLAFSVDERKESVSNDHVSGNAGLTHEILTTDL